MPDYRYEAIGIDGRSVKGRMTSESDRDVQRSLREQGLTPISVQLNEKAGITRKRFQSKAKTQDYILVLEELAVLLEAGVPLAESIDSISQSGIHPDLAVAMDEVSKSLKRGGKFSEALEKNLKKLPAYVHQLVAAGEMTGDLDSALKDSAKQMEYDLKIAQEIRSALTYPAILVSVGVLAVSFIFVSVVPKFEAMFEGRTDIPGLTKAIISTGVFFRENYQLVGSTLLGAIFLFMFLIRQEGFRRGFMEMVPKIPLFGPWFQESETGRWATTLSILLHNKIPLMDSLALAREGLKLPSLRGQMRQVETAVKGGKSLAQGLANHTQLPPLSLNLIKVGEQAGRLPQMLRSLASIYERAGGERMKRMLTLIEPLAIILIGGGIGLIFAGIVLGMTSITDTNI